MRYYAQVCVCAVRERGLSDVCVCASICVWLALSVFVHLRLFIFQLFIAHCFFRRFSRSGIQNINCFSFGSFYLFFLSFFCAISVFIWRNCSMQYLYVQEILYEI